MYIKRKIHDSIRKHVSRKEYTILTGARQSGKTSLIRALYRELKKEKPTVDFLSFEDTDILQAVDKHPEEIFSFTPRPEKILFQENKNKEPYYLFIDEVQYASDPSNFLKYLFDTYGGNLKIIATGSSAFYIDTKFKDSLAGRKRIFELPTLDFDEWLVFKGEKRLLDELSSIRLSDDYISAHHREFLEKLNEYLVFGGYPAVVLENEIQEKINLLKEIKNSFLKRDIIDSGVKHSDKFYNLFMLLASQTGNLVNRNELASTLQIDHKTVDKFLFIMQKCFLLGLLKPFYSNLRKELTKMPKVYFKDTGLRNVALNRFTDFRLREDSGALLESFVYRLLIQKYGEDNVRFWRTAEKKEIDFVISPVFGKGMAYEVKTKCRPLKMATAKKFNTHYPDYPIQTISYEPDRECQWVLKI